MWAADSKGNTHVIDARMGLAVKRFVAHHGADVLALVKRMCALTRASRWPVKKSNRRMPLSKEHVAAMMPAGSSATRLISWHVASVLYLRHGLMVSVHLARRRYGTTRTSVGAFRCSGSTRSGACLGHR